MAAPEVRETFQTEVHHDFGHEKSGNPRNSGASQGPVQDPPPEYESDDASEREAFFPSAYFLKKSNEGLSATLIFAGLHFTVASTFTDIIQANSQPRPDLNNESAALNGAPASIQGVDAPSTMFRIHAIGLAASYFSVFLAMLGANWLDRCASGALTLHSTPDNIIREIVFRAELLSVIPRAATFLVSCTLVPHLRKITITPPSVSDCVLLFSILSLYQNPPGIPQHFLRFLLSFAIRSIFSILPMFHICWCLLVEWLPYLVRIPGILIPRLRPACARIPALTNFLSLVDAFAGKTPSAHGSACERLLSRGFYRGELTPLIEKIFSSEEEVNKICCLSIGDAQIFVDVMDEALETLVFSPRIRRKCLQALYKLCSHHTLLPNSLQIPLCYDRHGFPLYRGGFAEVWKGKYRGQDVAVKIIRSPSHKELKKVAGRFCKEVVAWKTLRHPNVLPILGVTMNEFQFAMVSEWMENGNINEFVKENPDANLLELLGDVTKGLIYIHKQGMVHGDLKGANILIDGTRRARVADFSLLTVSPDSMNLFSSSSYIQGGTARWMSPELIDPERFGSETNRRTNSSDCYALGMVIYETISGHLPFHKYSDLSVFQRVLEGRRPPRGRGFADSLWEMLQRCWEPRPDARPMVKEVLQCLERVPGATSPGPGEDAETEGNDDRESSSDSSGEWSGLVIDNAVTV